jgi:hypothetical protein
MVIPYIFNHGQKHCSVRSLCSRRVKMRVKMREREGCDDEGNYNWNMRAHTNKEG